MKSLHIFMDSKHLTKAVRLSLEPFGIINEGNAEISIIPLYSVKSIYE